MRPRLLLLDEPTASVDQEGAEQLCRAVSEAVSRDGITLVVVEHRVALWEPVVDRVIVLDEHGRVAFDGPTRETLHDARHLLQEQGTWVPGWVPTTRAPAPADTRGPDAGEVLLSARDLAVSRVQPTRREIARTLLAAMAQSAVRHREITHGRITNEFGCYRPADIITVDRFA